MALSWLVVKLDLSLPMKPAPKAILVSDLAQWKCRWKLDYPPSSI